MKQNLRPEGKKARWERWEGRRTKVRLFWPKWLQGWHRGKGQFVLVAALQSVWLTCKVTTDSYVSTDLAAKTISVHFICALYGQLHSNVLRLPQFSIPPPLPSFLTRHIFSKWPLYFWRNLCGGERKTTVLKTFLDLTQIRLASSSKFVSTDMTVTIFVYYELICLYNKIY